MKKIICKSCGKELESGSSFCPKCSTSTSAFATSVQNQSLQTNPAQITADITQSFVPAKSHKKLIIIIIAVIILLSGIAATLLFTGIIGGKYLSFKMEEVEEWYLKSDESNEHISAICEWWDIKSPEIEYTETNDENIQLCNFNSTGLNIAAYVDADSKIVQDVVILTEGYSIFESLYDDEQSIAVRYAALEVAEEQNRAILNLFLRNIFDLSEPEAEDILDEAGDIAKIEKNGIEYNIIGKKNDLDLCLIITTQKDEKSFMDYIEKINKED